ncbi:nonstructural protein [Mona Grita virus]|uniref:Nonstructural protein n=1 Tax=Mona Grita virus TaxID=2559111 RepID=A0A482KEM8_9VIRU|nr:nonstructural protein [Mona Grita virus]QBQ01756.1 nonstructural protein [Mona Grita virus]
MNFLYDQPVIFRMGGVGDPEVEVGYLPFEAWSVRKICVHNTMEIPLETYRFAMDHRPTLRDFYSRGEFPFRWGPGTFNSRVQEETTNSFDSAIMDLVGFPLASFTKSFLPNVKLALSWPLGYPTTDFIQLSGIPGHFTHNGWKGMAATSLFRMNPQLERFDQVFVEAHKSILEEAERRGLSSDYFTGYDLLKEVASLQIVRLLNAVDIDVVYSNIPTNLTYKLLDLRDTFENESPELLGNRFWIPSPDTWFDGLYLQTDSSFSSDED